VDLSLHTIPKCAINHLVLLYPVFSRKISTNDLGFKMVSIARYFNLSADKVALIQPLMSSGLTILNNP